MWVIAAEENSSLPSCKEHRFSKGSWQISQELLHSVIEVSLGYHGSPGEEIDGCGHRNKRGFLEALTPELGLQDE